MRYSQLMAALLLASIACNPVKRSPLADIGVVTSARIVASTQLANAEDRVVRDTALLYSIVRLGSSDGSWQGTWHTTPSGQLRAALYRDTILLGVVAISPTFVGARAAGREEFRALEPSEQRQVAALLSQFKL